MRIPIYIPNTALPKKDIENPCDCQDRPVKLLYKTGILTWRRQVGDRVKLDDVVCEGEVEKKALEFLSPADGTLTEICLGDGEGFAYGDILGYIENDA